MPQLVASDSAPKLTLPTIDGNTFNLEDMKGKKVILTSPTLIPNGRIIEQIVERIDCMFNRF